MIGISLGDLLFVVGRQLQLLPFDERTTDPRFLSVFPALYRLICDRISFQPDEFYLIILVFSFKPRTNF
jgi:hypothetical protein